MRAISITDILLASGVVVDAEYEVVEHPVKEIAKGEKKKKDRK